MVVLGQFFGFGQSRLHLGWEEVGLADGVKSYSVLGEQTSGGVRRSVPQRVFIIM